MHCFVLNLHNDCTEGCPVTVSNEELETAKSKINELTQLKNKTTKVNLVCDCVARMCKYD